MSAPRCVWCNGGGDLMTVALNTPDRFLSGMELREFCVHTQHEGLLRDQVAFIERSRKPFMASLGVALALLPLVAIGAAALDLPERTTMVAVGLCLSLVGSVVTLYPLPTPETVDALGIQRSTALVRGLGMAVTAAGLFLAAFLR